ncbi:hypothetical protein E4U17_001980, partial [Claviceps sp. LM77 group G4]
MAFQFPASLSDLSKSLPNLIQGHHPTSTQLFLLEHSVHSRDTIRAIQGTAAIHYIKVYDSLEPGSVIL